MTIEVKRRERILHNDHDSNDDDEMNEDCEFSDNGTDNAEWVMRYPFIFIVVSPCFLDLNEILDLCQCTLHKMTKQ